MIEKVSMLCDFLEASKISSDMVHMKRYSTYFLTLSYGIDF